MCADSNEEGARMNRLLRTLCVAASLSASTVLMAADGYKDNNILISAEEAVKLIGNPKVMFVSGDNEDIYKLGDLELNDYNKVVTRKGREISLTNTEYRLLYYFMNNLNRVLSRLDILEKVWDINYNLGTNVVDVYVNYLRKKIDNDEENKLIHTVIGMGYVMKQT